MTGNPTNSYCIKGKDEKLIFLIYSHEVSLQVVLGTVSKLEINKEPKRGTTHALKEKNKWLPNVLTMMRLMLDCLLTRDSVLTL